MSSPSVGRLVIRFRAFQRFNALQVEEQAAISAGAGDIDPVLVEGDGGFGESVGGVIAHAANIELRDRAARLGALNAGRDFSQILRLGDAQGFDLFAGDGGDGGGGVLHAGAAALRGDDDIAQSLALDLALRGGGRRRRRLGLGERARAACQAQSEGGGEQGAFARPRGAGH
jgi:hypothetical protein